MPLGENVERVLVDGRAAHPDVDASFYDLRHLVARRLQGEPSRGTVDAEELFLACACVLDDDNARLAFTKRYLMPLVPLLGVLSLDRAEIADLEAVLRSRLFVGTHRSKSITVNTGLNRSRGALDDAPEHGELPRVIAYAGHGQLDSLVRAAGVRAAIELLIACGRLDRSADPIVLPLRSGDSALATLAASCSAAFKPAFEATIAATDATDRRVLDLVIVRGLSLDQIADRFGVHRALAGRWVTAARTHLALALFDRLATVLGVGADSVELRALVEAHLELSLEPLLRAQPDTAE